MNTDNSNYKKKNLSRWKKLFFEDLEENEKDLSKRIVISIRGILLFFAIVWVASGAIVYYVIPDWANRGTFGDMFGAVNALFSAFAFGGLIYTILIQRYELTLQRRELQLQRLEVKRNGDQLEEQKKIMAQQSFENTFFKLIELHHQIINSINATLLEGAYPRRELFERIRVDIEEEIKFTQSREVYFAKISYIVELYDVHINHYLSNVTSIYKMIEHHAESSQQAARDTPYTMIMYNQLSKDEKFILFYLGSNVVGMRHILLNEDYFRFYELELMHTVHYEWLKEDFEERGR